MLPNAKARLMCGLDLWILQYYHSGGGKSFSGNLCRCTGYRSILDAYRGFSADVDMEDLDLNTFWSSDGKDASIFKLHSIIPDAIKAFPNFLITNIENSMDQSAFEISSSHGNSSETCWYRPMSLDNLQALLAKWGCERNLNLVVGNTSYGIYKELGQNPIYIDRKSVPELSVMRKDTSGFEIGAHVTISHVIHALRKDLDNGGESDGAIFIPNL